MNEYWEVCSDSGQFIGFASSQKEALKIGEQNEHKHGDWGVYIVNDYSLKSN